MHWRTLHIKARKHIPVRIAERLDKFATHVFFLSERLKIRRVFTDGPPYRPSYKAIIIDITTLCNRYCLDCNRSVGKDQAMSAEHMSMAQIDKFIEESIVQQKYWERIDIEGGEPTLHPEFFKILRHLLCYRREHSPGTNIRILTNGYGVKVNKVIARLPSLGVDVYNSRKTSSVQNGHCAFNVAPRDLQQCTNEDFSQGCHLPAVYGLGLTRHGYYPHPVCGGIDRVFGFNLGRKQLPQDGDAMQDQLENLCRFCGFYLYSRQLQYGQKQLLKSPVTHGFRTESWQQAYLNYKTDKPELTLY